ncbi:hypothetical protein OROGR_008251 [Orobanche gracilis]
MTTPLPHFDSLGLARFPTAIPTAAGKNRTVFFSLHSRCRTRFSSSWYCSSQKNKKLCAGRL